jgi:two-component system, NarL family, response regulator
VNRILVVDDHPFVRDSLAELLGHEPDLVEAGTGAHAREAIALVDRLAPDIVLIDLNMECAGRS